MPDLSEVFGISNSVPEHTYVNRDGLDEEFQHLMRTKRHLVIYGASKQGKTVLRKKNLPSDKAIVVQCRLEQSVEEIYIDILRQLGADIPTQFTNAKGIRGGGKADINVPFIGGTEAHTEIESQSETTSVPIGMDESSLGYVAEKISASDKKIVVEDFHYLSEDEKRRFAYDLKTLYELDVYFIVVGIWAQQNLLGYYLGDLQGRVDEIDVRWADYELARVLQKGEHALSVDFGEDIRLAMITDATGNVGLLQRIAERYCRQKRIWQSQSHHTNLADASALDTSRLALCSEQEGRYGNFIEQFSRGFGKTKFKMYLRICRVCAEADDAELIDGIHYRELLKRVQVYEPRARDGDLYNALSNVNRLQVKKNLSPLVLYYNSNTRTIQLVDREFLFYRKYKNTEWPWDYLEELDIDSDEDETDNE